MRRRFQVVSQNLAMWAVISITAFSSFAHAQLGQPDSASGPSMTVKRTKVSKQVSKTAKAASKNAKTAPVVTEATNPPVNPSTDNVSSAPAAVRPQDDSPVGSAWNELATTQNSATAEQPTSWRKAKETKFAYKFGSGFDSFANEREQSQYFGFGIGGDFQAQLMDSLSFRAKASANVSSGYAQSRFGDNVGSSGLYVDEAILNLRAIDTSLARLYVAGGAISQGAFDESMFISRQAFPGVKETLVFGNSKEFKFRVWAQQTIPTSKNLSTKTVDAEVTPTFMTQTVDMQIKPNDTFTFKAAVTHFTFNSLPSAIAQESIIYGNTVDEIGPNTSRFRYAFDGLFASSGLDIDITRRFGWWIAGAVIQNAAAPEGYRNAQHIKSGFKIGLPGEIDVVPSFGTYFIEDDAVPGFYNSSGIGHTNRQGYGAGLETYFQRQKFKVKAEYNDADVINFNINQSRQQSLMIGFETFYEML